MHATLKMNGDTNIFRTVASRDMDSGDGCMIDSIHARSRVSVEESFSTVRGNKFGIN